MIRLCDTRSTAIKCFIHIIHAGLTEGLITRLATAIVLSTVLYTTYIAFGRQKKDGESDKIKLVVNRYIGLALAVLFV